MFIRVSAGPVRITVGDDVRYSPDVLDDIMAQASRTVLDLLPKYSEHFPDWMYEEDDEDADAEEFAALNGGSGAAPEEDEEA